MPTSDPKNAASHTISADHAWVRLTGSPRTTKNVILAGFIVAFPCFVFLMFCAGFLPVGAMAVLAGSLVDSGDPAALVLLVPLVLEAGIYVFLLNKLALVVARYVQRDRRRGGPL